MRKRCWKAQPNAKRNQTSGIIPEQPCGNARTLARRNLQQHGKFHVACVKPTEPILVCGWKTSRGRANSGFPSFLATSNGLGVTCIITVGTELLQSVLVALMGYGCPLLCRDVALSMELPTSASLQIRMLRNRKSTHIHPDVSQTLV